MNRTATFREIENLRAACNNSINWSTMGRWRGDGPETSCFGKKVISQSSHRLVIKFNSENGWKEWNKYWEGGLSVSLGTLTAFGGALLTASSIGKFAQSLIGLFSTGSSITISLNANLPIVSQGWKAESTETFSLISSSTKGSYLLKTITLKVITPTGNIDSKRESIIEYPVRSQQELNLYSKITTINNTIKLMQK